MSAGGWLTKKEETIKDKASFTNIKMDVSSFPVLSFI